MTKADIDIEIGTRFECDGHKGTVLFVGEVPPTKGVWLGVEWDDVSRGKHDGMHEGKRYFTTSQPGAGSFIRSKKANFGISLLRAIKERYGLIDDENAGVKTEEMFVLGKNQQTTVEIVGARSVNLQQSKLNRLQNVDVRDSLVNGTSHPGELQEAVPNVLDLDMQANLLGSWQKVASICSQLCRLGAVNLSENTMSFPERPEDLREAFESVKVIYLNKMNYTWEQVVLCCQMMQKLHQLHLCFNQINHLSSLLSLAPHLCLVNLESNPIKDWRQILALGDLPCLQTLIANDCTLSSIEFLDASPTQKTKLFPKLHTLLISHNKLDKWQSIDELNKLQCLKDLMVQQNPLLLDDKMSDATMRSLIIAKISGLKSCNRTVIDSVERKGAEIDYLKVFGLAWLSAGGNQDSIKNKPNQAFLHEHPRFASLINIYGPPEDDELKEHSTAIKNNLISVTIKSPYVPEKAPIKKKLPLTMTVQTLKVLLRRLYKVSPSDMHLSYISDQMVGYEIEFETDTKDIGYYSIDEGDTILVKW